MSRRRASKLLAAVACLAVAASGCARTTVVGSERTLYVALSEYRLRPQNVRVSAGALTILVHNYGRLTHNLVVSLNGLYEGSTRPLPPGQDGMIVLTLTPGKYLMASNILSDQALGDYGTLTVTR